MKWKRAKRSFIVIILFMKYDFHCNIILKFDSQKNIKVKLRIIRPSPNLRLITLLLRYQQNVINLVNLLTSSTCFLALTGKFKMITIKWLLVFLIFILYWYFNSDFIKLNHHQRQLAKFCDGWWSGYHSSLFVVSEQILPSKNRIFG